MIKVEEWRKNDFAQSLFANLLPEVLDYVQCNFLPEDLFPEEDLTIWAKEHGYVKEVE